MCPKTATNMHFTGAYVNVNKTDYSHLLMDFCSSYAGFLNASSKNQMLFTAQMNGKNANPTETNTTNMYQLNFTRKYFQLSILTVKVPFG